MSEFPKLFGCGKKAFFRHYKILKMSHLQSLQKFQWNQIYHTPETIGSGARGAVDWSRVTVEGGQLQSIAPTYIPQAPNTFTLRLANEEAHMGRR